MKLIKLGQYDLGMRRVDLFVQPNMRGGSFNSSPESGVCEIVVGLNERNWSAVVAILHHEALELAFTELGLRYVPSPDYANDAAAYQFSMNHTQFGEAVARAAYFFTQAMPVLATAYRKHGKRKQ